MIPEVVEDDANLIWQFDSAMQVNSGTITYKHLNEPNYDKEVDFKEFINNDSLASFKTDLGDFLNLSIKSFLT